MAPPVPRRTAKQQPADAPAPERGSPPGGAATAGFDAPVDAFLGYLAAEKGLAAHDMITPKKSTTPMSVAMTQGASSLCRERSETTQTLV